MGIDDLGERLKAQLPTGIHRKISEILEDFKQTITIYDELSDELILNPLTQIVEKLENKTIKPIPSMRKIQNLQKWSEIFKDAHSKSYKPESLGEPGMIDKLWFIFMGEVSAGRNVDLGTIFSLSKQVKDTKPEAEFRDITSSNLIVTLGDILADIEEMYEKDIPGSSNLLKLGQYDDIDISIFNIEDEWAQKQIKTGNATRISIRNLILERRSEFTRGMEIHRIFNPLNHELHVLISLMPVLLTMLYEDVEGIGKIRDDCNDIFMELSMGAELERITSSLKEKIGKHREVEELQINATAIDKSFKKIKNALNIKVFSYLRRLKVQTIIEDVLFNQSAEIGLDLTGLNSKFGKATAPHEYEDMILEISRLFSTTTIELKKLIAPRLPEEIGIKIKPNLNEFNNLINQIEFEVEKYYLMIPPHIAPLYAGPLYNTIEIMQNCIQEFAPLKKHVLKQIFIHEDAKMKFYLQIKEECMRLKDAHDKYNQFFELALKLANTDQIMAINFTKKICDVDHYNNQYQHVFDKSLKDVRRMLAMKTLSQEDASIIIKKVNSTKEAVDKFVQNWTLEEICKILNNSNKIHLKKQN